MLSDFILKLSVILNVCIALLEVNSVTPVTQSDLVVASLGRALVCHLWCSS